MLKAVLLQSRSSKHPTRPPRATDAHPDPEACRIFYSWGLIVFRNGRGNGPPEDHPEARTFEIGYDSSGILREACLGSSHRVAYRLPLRFYTFGVVQWTRVHVQLCLAYGSAAQYRVICRER